MIARNSKVVCLSWQKKKYINLHLSVVFKAFISLERKDTQIRP